MRESPPNGKLTYSYHIAMEALDAGCSPFGSMIYLPLVIFQFAMGAHGDSWLITRGYLKGTFEKVLDTAHVRGIYFPPTCRWHVTCSNDVVLECTAPVSKWNNIQPISQIERNWCITCLLHVSTYLLSEMYPWVSISFRSFVDFSFNCLLLFHQPDHYRNPPHSWR